MFNDDLIAYLQPIPHRFNSCEWRDVTGALTDIRVEPHRFTLRAALSPGLYRGRMETLPGAFDMGTAMVDMVRVPDGKVIPVGPWDLNHIEGYMAMPMAKAYVNGKLKGGLWFAMPGPEQIAQGQLSADFGFEAEAGQTELTLEFIERDRARLDWGRMRFMELRRDDRVLCQLTPSSKRRPRIYVNAGELAALRRRLLPDPRFCALVEKLTRVEVGFGVETAGNLDVACLAYLVTRDKDIGEKVVRAIVDLCSLASWSGQGHSQGQKDPLLMGGDNDRGIGYRLYYSALAWDYLGSEFSARQRRVVLDRVGEYLQKMYDFTLLQREYMGCPSPDPHALGAYSGVGVACMAFYDELPIARKALPFFHGLMRDSLRLFPGRGKTAWATFFPFFLIRYLAAAHTFGGNRPELNQSPFLDNLGNALLACFQTPNTQEMQRGLRTFEHRYLTAYLHRFHPTPGIAAIYQRFVEQEKQAAGDVQWGHFDLLYGPVKPVKAAAFPTLPLLAKDIGDIIGTTHGKPSVGFSLSAGHKAGHQAAFSLLSHNREFPMSMAALEVTVDGAPVLVNINISTYGLNSALTNTMCFEDGGMLTNGQYLNGKIGPEKCGQLRRVIITGRFVYAHAIITATLHPDLRVTQADRVIIVDLRTGIILLADSFAGTRPIRFATHLHCSGSAAEVAAGGYRLSGGQANLIAGIKGGEKGMSDQERGEIFVTVLDAPAGHRVLIEEPQWIPGYIYGINDGKNTDPAQAKYPHYHRWRLEAAAPVTDGAFLLGLATRPGTLTRKNGRVCMPDGAWVEFSAGKAVNVMGCQCVAEAVVVDETAGDIVLAGVREIILGRRKLRFAVPVDVDMHIADAKMDGVLYAPAQDAVESAVGFHVDKAEYRENNPRSGWSWSARFASANMGKKIDE